MVIFNGSKVERTKDGGKKITVVTRDGFEEFQISPCRARLIDELVKKYLRK